MRRGCRIKKRGSACAAWSTVLSRSDPTALIVQSLPKHTRRPISIPVGASTTASEIAQRVEGSRSTTVDVAGSNAMKMGAENDLPEPSEQNPEKCTTTHKRISSSEMSEEIMIYCQEPFAKAILSARTMMQWQLYSTSNYRLCTNSVTAPVLLWTR